MSFSEWTIRSFQELTVNHDKKRRPLSSKERETMQGKYPYYGAQGIIDTINNYIFDGTFMLIAEDGENLKSKKQNIAQIASGKFWVNNHAHIVTGSELADLRYLCYLFNNTDVSGYITGSAQPKLSQANLNSIKCTVPPLPEQKAIAATLSCLDDKIELNNRINKNLEEMAQAIFKSWFVDFEPFQDGEFEDSELGRIPKGWRVESLDNIATYLNGLAMQKYRPDKDEFLPVIKIKELNQGYTDENSDKASVDIPEQYIIKNGDVIFSWSGTLSVKIWTGGEGGLNQHLFKVTSDKYLKWFYYFWTLSYLEKFKAIAQDKATTMGHIKRSHLSEAKVLIPMSKELIYMDNIMNPILEKMIEIKVQNEVLKNIKDSLLPKLMSGEVRVPVEEVLNETN